MNVYRFYFSTARNSPTLVPFSCDLQCVYVCVSGEGVHSVRHAHTDWTPPQPPPPLGETSINWNAWLSSIFLIASIPASLQCLCRLSPLFIDFHSSSPLGIFRRRPRFCWPVLELGVLTRGSSFQCVLFNRLLLQAALSVPANSQASDIKSPGTWTASLITVNARK